jgi:hypothetical protein
MDDTPTGNCLNETFCQFDPEAQARITKAEETSRERLSDGAAAVADRLLAAGSPDGTDWAVQPENDARVDAARLVFVAYVNELWRQTDGKRSEHVHAFLVKIERLKDPILARYGLAGGDLLNDLLHICVLNIQIIMQRSMAVEASGATEERKTAVDPTDEVTTFLRDHGILQFLHPWRVTQRRNTRLNAELSRRRRSKNDSEFAEREDRLQDARAWARAEIGQNISKTHNVFELKDQIVNKTWNDFGRGYFKLGYQEFVIALWEEGSPPLEDYAIAVLAERARSAALLDMPEGKQQGRNPSRKRQADAGLQNLKARIRELRDEGLTHEGICFRLGNSPRPPRATWRDLEWPFAYRRHTGAVAKWLSDALR